MRVLAFAASFRTGSWNKKLVELAARMARADGADVDLADFREFDMPLYDGDVDKREGLPPGALELKRRLDDADAVLLSVPEYNYSIPGTLKNAIDWISRARPIPLRGKALYLMAASPSAIGGIRGLWQTRIPLEGCGALVFPDMFALAHASTAFGDDGDLRDPLMRQRLTRELVGFLSFAEAVRPICHGESDDERRRQERILAAIEDESTLQGAAE